ncbi:MAG: ParA family protein [Alphaproteobacteria bacterium]|nr:ParA family protein [Alphaproteobacteria bacterium]
MTQKNSLNKHREPRIIAVANQKGGVGKTTTAVNLATAISAINKKVLIIDLDPQGNASVSVGLSRLNNGANAYSVLTGRRRLSDTVSWTKIPNLSLVPASLDLLGIDIEFAEQENPQFFLKKALKTTPSGYDYIIIDCPPAVGLLTINALVAADAVIVPIQCEYLALEGVADLVKTIEKVKKNFNPGLDIQGIVLTMFDARNNLSDMVASDVRGYFGDKVYNTVIPRNVRVSEAPSHGKPVLLYDWRCPGAQAYISLAGEMLKREEGICA